MKRHGSDRASLASRYKYRLQRRRTIEGIALEADCGDRGCIRSLAGWGMVLMERASDQDTDLAPAAEWLANIMARISAGESPNEAFGYEQPRVRPKLEDFYRLETHWILGSHVAALVGHITGKTYGAAANFVAEHWHVSAQRAAEVMLSATADVAAISGALAKELALDVVEAFGAGGRRASRNTISEAYKAYLSQE